MLPVPDRTPGERGLRDSSSPTSCSAQAVPATTHPHCHVSSPVCRAPATCVRARALAAWSAAGREAAARGTRPLALPLAADPLRCPIALPRCAAPCPARRARC